MLYSLLHTQVLMMTLSNDPPTLPRESTKYKYSRIFKEMIDLCLNKDPAKRLDIDMISIYIY